jgi:hypothetical protein
MFDKEYSFRGSHAEKVIKLTAEFDKNKHKLFNRNIDVYLTAPIIGFLYGRRSELDRSAETTKIFPEQLIHEQSNLLFAYRLIMLLDKDYEPDLNKRIDKAFRYYNDDEKAASDKERFEEYVRGGVDVLYEKLLSNISSEEDYILNLYNFMEEFEERYNRDINIDNILELCRLV